MTDPIRERHVGEHPCLGNVGPAIYDPGTPCDAIQAADERDALLAAFSSEHVKWLQRVNGYPTDWRPDDLADWLDMVLDDIGAHLRADA